ncbi:STAS/SEC14 domain-containing protein [uncultured Roseobacter sp.]|uniref:STAS/SEC14 domain-containing protein n=1 Tax=uncultured Roseobacter sp. TaxID=114847 RepID=UPI002607B45D|nr:STAS/SEC14 domain-containing protein [uncultured Roseobacter sp.]
MTNLTLPSVREIPTHSDTVYAFDVTGHVSDDDAEALAKYMNDAFDRHDKVNMLIRLSGYTGSDKDALFDGDVLESRWRALFKVDKYAVVGAPDGASRMISIMDKILPVDAKTFETSEEDEAWRFIGTAAADDDNTQG